MKIFKPKIKEGRRVFQDANGYILELEIYEQHKEYLDKVLPFVMDFKLFHYGIGLTRESFKEYKKDYYKKLLF